MTHVIYCFWKTTTIVDLMPHELPSTARKGQDMKLVTPNFMTHQFVAAGVDIDAVPE